MLYYIYKIILAIHIYIYIHILVKAGGSIPRKLIELLAHMQVDNVFSSYVRHGRVFSG